MVPVGLAPQIDSWFLFTVAENLLNKAFNVSLKESAEACDTLGGVEFSDEAYEIINKSQGIEATFVATANKILKGLFDPALSIIRESDKMAKYGEKMIKLKGGEAQLEIMFSAENLLKFGSQSVDVVNQAKIENRSHFQECLANEFGQSQFDIKKQLLLNACEKLLPYAQKTEMKRIEQEDSTKIVHTCLWNTIRCSEPFVVCSEDGSVLASDTLECLIQECWPARVVVTASSALQLE